MSKSSIIKYKTFHLVFFTIAFILMGVIFSHDLFSPLDLSGSYQTKNIIRGIIAGYLTGGFTSFMIIKRYKPEEIKSGGICAAVVSAAELIFITIIKIV
ncbi:MAG: hypothetical protein V1720_13560 [bacterium]